MFGVHRLILLVALVAIAFVSAAPHHNDDSLVDWGRLSSLLDTVDNSVLHSVLHNLSPKFRDGVFSKDRAAVEHVHSTNPILASKLVYIAKRQTNETTTASTPTDPTTSATVATVATVAETVSDAVSSLITASTVPAPTTIQLAPSTAPGETAIETISGAVVFSSVGGGVVTRTSSAVGVSFTRSTSTHIFTFTASDGSLQTSTSLIVVNAPVTATAVQTGAAGAAATSGDPGLQNVAGRQSSSELTMLMGAAFAGVVGLFVAL